LLRKAKRRRARRARRGKRPLLSRTTPHGCLLKQSIYNGYSEAAERIE
jgi:hypothetical protein